jgi:geranylgeranyl diphosphate synthase type I
VPSPTPPASSHALPTAAHGISTSPVDVERLRSRVDTALAAFLERQAGTLEAVSPDCGPLAESVATLMRGGKRLRPAFCYWGWRGAGGDEGEPIAKAAASLELFQAAALIHDDLMDGSDSRRGMPAVHRRFASLHRGQGWRGDGDRFGLAGAVLAGDMCLVWTDELFAASGLPVERLEAARPLFNRMRTELLGGQYLDVLGQTAADDDPGADTVERARHVIRYKSAKYTVEHPLLIGATLAGADDALLATYSAFGLPLGEAFQLRDDLLGVFGDEEVTGKPVGEDLREGKPTLLYAMAVEQASEADNAVLARYGAADLDDDEVAALQDVLLGSGAVETVEGNIDRLVAEAVDAIDGAGLTDEAHEALVELAYYVAGRDR